MRRIVALVGLMIIALSGCGQGQTDQQREVATALVTHLERLHAGDFQGACALVDPSIRDYGQPCPQQWAQMWPADLRAQLVSIAVDSSQIRLDDSTHATVPAGALSYSGHPSTGDDFHLVKVSDQWMVG
jgi:hypothetical protein